MKKITRRNFLKNSGKNVALGATVGLHFGSAKSYSRIPGANERINLALIGCGGRGNWVARGFIEDGATISYICDPHAGRRDKLTKILAESQGKNPKKTKDFRKILDDKDVDAVIVATPNHWHALPTILACQAGKEVYLEKPQSNNIWEGRKMIEAARKYNRIVQIGTQSRSAPYVVAAREYIQNGNLGDIHLVKVFNLKSNAGFQKRDEPFILGAPQTVPPELDWDLWLGRAPYHPYNEKLFARHGWIAFWDFSEGDMDDAIHQVDLAVDLMSEPTPKTVVSSGGRLHFKGDDAEVPDMLESTFEFENFLMTLELAGYPRYMQKTSTTIRRNDEFPYWTQNATRIELYGSKELMIIGRHGGGWITMTSGGKVVNKMYGRVPDAAHRQNFLECVKSRKRPNADVEIVNNSANLVHMANIAHRIGNQKLSYDAGAERFVNNNAANALLKCSQREKYAVPKKV